MQCTTPVKNLATLSISGAIEEAGNNLCHQIQATEQTACQEFSGHGTAPFPPAVWLNIKQRHTQRLVRSLVLYVDNTDITPQDELSLLRNSSN
jgi:hypothetical protein